VEESSEFRGEKGDWNYLLVPKVKDAIIKEYLVKN
jgi:hypothetical protein